ncbi:MAG: rhomboid family intramembrane serine protease [Bacteroidales bacterium]|nr:rhomboid family intramembrane serine protease [Bacteroidales bacterium]MCM1415577.1 rhomboid family intramembrane serine protease [bacterium]MCM1424105.1 rhomboid family intramembrane serine protease [bacterium]
MDILTLNRLEDLFYAQGYEKLPSNLPEFNFYCHREMQGINVLHVIDYRQGLYISGDQYAHLKEKITEFFARRGEPEIHVMTLILSEDTEKARRLCEEDAFCWIIDAGAFRLIVHETQVSDFYGWKGILEEYLLAAARESAETEPGAKRSKMDLRTLSPINVLLVTVNVIVFIICTFTGDLLYNKGAFGAVELLQGDFYRLFTAMFLHWDVEHLFSNMIVLYYVGAMVEREFGPFPYVAIYLLSGLAGNIFSVGYELLTGSYGISAGASGAVFGVEGALLLLVMLHRGRLSTLTAGRVAFAIAFSLYCGFTSAGINNAAHVGGVLMGFLTAAVVAAVKKMWKLSEYG